MRLKPQIDIYRDAENGPCKVCMMQGENWKETVIDVSVFNNSKFQIGISDLIDA